MLPKGTIRTERVWKRFKADRRRMLLRDKLERTVARLRGAPNLGYRWVLRDIDFEVAPGEAIGLIGSNGSGKSTLLKILTRVMCPHTGRVVAEGRVGALIEVRAGIHPDLSGRENIYLYGSLLGLTRRQVAARFDDIVSFAEVEGAIDRQVKFYSSGMQMRLGFAVAAFLEPDILLVDEVLAVGDASFQQKCLNRMRAVLAEGTTLVFVSHDLAAVEATCSRGLWLDQGVIRSDGPVREVLGEYRASVEEMAESGRGAGGIARVTKVSVSGSGDDVPRTSEPFDVQLVIDSPIATSGRLCWHQRGHRYADLRAEAGHAAHRGRDRGPLPGHQPPAATRPLLPVAGDVRQGPRTH
ncbi:MAG TPA: ABC transporter ATP-binding protein, partial [Mycobacteriales bacterium]|nr:ABC transporter ATP-binding protein [Mycobacteriales bacterium]